MRLSCPRIPAPWSAVLKASNEKVRRVRPLDGFSTPPFLVFLTFNAQLHRAPRGKFSALGSGASLLVQACEAVRCTSLTSRGYSKLLIISVSTCRCRTNTHAGCARFSNLQACKQGCNGVEKGPTLAPSADQIRWIR